MRKIDSLAPLVTNSYFAVLEVENGAQGDIAGIQISVTGIPNLQVCSEMVSE